MRRIWSSRNHCCNPRFSACAEHKSKPKGFSTITRRNPDSSLRLTNPARARFSTAGANSSGFNDR